MSTEQNPQNGEDVEHVTPEPDAETTETGKDVKPPTTDENNRPVDNPSG